MRFQLLILFDISFCLDKSFEIYQIIFIPHCWLTCNYRETRKCFSLQTDMKSYKNGTFILLSKGSQNNHVPFCKYMINYFIVEQFTARLIKLSSKLEFYDLISMQSRVSQFDWKKKWDIILMTDTNYLSGFL